MQSVNHLTELLQRDGYESSAEVVVEKALKDVQRDVGQAGVGEGVHSQHQHVRSHYAACQYITLHTLHTH